MADADVQGMLIRIEATTTQLRQEIARGDAAVAQSAGKIHSSLGRIDSAFDRTGENAGALQKAVSAAFTGIGLASAAAVAGMVAITVKTANYAQEVKNLSSLSNSSVADFQRLAAGAKTVGVEQDKLGDILKDTTDRVGEFIQRGGGEMSDFFKEIAPKVGVTAQMFANLSGPDALQLYYNSLEKAGLNQAQMTTYMESMADEATALIPLLKNNGEGFKTFGDRAEKAGQILSSFEIDKLVEVNQSIKALEGSFEGASRQLVLGMLPGIQSVTDRLTSMSNSGAMEVLGAGVGFLADHLNILAAVMGAKVAASFAGYVQSLGASTLASSKARAANIAQAASAVEAAAANQIAAQSAVVRAEREAIAARSTAVQTQMSIQLAEARLAERAATSQLVAAQTGLKAASGSLLGILGGPAGIAALAVGAGIAFLALRDNTGDLEKKLGDLSDPIDKLTKKFNELDRATQSVTLRELRSTIADAQKDLSTAANSISFEFQSSLTNAGLAGASGFMAGIAPLPAEFQAAIDIVKKASADQASGMVVDWKAVADEVRQVPGVTAEVADALEKSGGAAATSNTELAKLKDTVSQLTGETDELTRAERENAAAKAAASGVGQKYLEQLQKQLGAAQDKTSLEAANRFIAENTDLTEGMVTAIRSAAAAKDAQKAADDAATKAIKSGTSASKEAATEAKNQAKALTDLKTQADIAISAATGLAAAYLAGTEKSREFTLQKKVEEALLKTGAAARKDVEKAINDQQDAQDRLNVSKSAFDLGKETADLIAQATATLQGADALAAYNAEKALTIALANKNIEVGSKEYNQMLGANEAQKEALKLVQQAGTAGGIMDRLYPEAKLLKDYTEDQKALNAVIALGTEKTPLYQDALAKIGNEYEVNRSKATIWGQMTEGAIDRIDEAFATAWGNIGSGAETLWDNLKKGFKQTLGEIAHMLTTKPLLASISNWLTGTDNGQGLSSEWNKLLGSATGQQGGSSSGMAGMGNNLVSMGKSIYQAYSAITGVGSSVASGYASGGISGALSGGASYYGNMLTSLGSTLSGGFSSMVSAITGGTAATTGATSALGATLSGAVAEGAAAVGTNIGVAGATTAAASSGISGSVTTAMSSMAAMWPLAVVAGMYQSGKLYDAGVRPDSGEIMDAGGKTALGKAAMAPGAAMSGFFEAQDKVLSKVVGDKWAAILSGSTLHQAVTKYVGEKLFGGAWQTKDGGISLGVENGEFDAQQYIDQKKKGGLFSSSKKRTRYSALDADTEDALGTAYNEKILNSMGLFSALGVQLSEAVLDGLNVAASKISTQGKTTEEIQTELDSWFTSLGNSAVTAISDATNSGIGNYNFDQLTTFVNDLYSINDVFKLLNVNALPISVWGGKLTEQYVALAGGMEALTTAATSYYDAFFSETEKADDTLTAVNQQFASMNLALPDSRDGFRAMVEGIDSTTDAGRSMFFTLMGLSTAAASAYDILEQRAAEAQAASEAATEAAAQAAQAALDLAQTLLDALVGAAGNASSAVQRAIAAEQKAATSAYNARINSLNDMVSTATENVSGLTEVGNDLSAALKALRGDSDGAVKMLRAQAQATLQSALARAKAGGSLSGFTGLEDALDTVSNNNTDLYGSMEDFVRDQGRTANVVAELNGLNGKQLTTAEKSLKSLETQIDLATAAYDAQMAQYDKQLEFAQEQMDALNGIDNSVLSVVDAINAMNLNVVAALGGMGGKPAGGNTSANNGALVDSVYRSVLGREADTAGKAYWVGQLESGAISYAMLQEAIATAAREKGQAVKPGYAAGGLISGPGSGTSDSILARLSNGEYVMRAAAVSAYGTGLLDQMNSMQLPAFAGGGGIGEVGPQLEVTGPSRIYSVNQTASMLRGGGDNGELIAEVRQLRTENRQAQFQIVKLTQKIEQTMNQWNGEGMPQERNYAQ